MTVNDKHTSLLQFTMSLPIKQRLIRKPTQAETAKEINSKSWLLDLPKKHSSQMKVTANDKHASLLLLGMSSRLEGAYPSGDL